MGSRHCITRVFLLVLHSIIIVHALDGNATLPSWGTPPGSNATQTLSAIEFEKIAEVINSMNSTWKADSRIIDMSPIIVDISLGFSMEPSFGAAEATDEVDDRNLEKFLDELKLPENFDLRTEYPMCTNIGHVMYQSNCGSCWALSTAAAFSDRMCISTEGALNFLLSADHLITCCQWCSSKGGCNGGDPLVAWHFIKKKGVPTGGDFASHQGCKPYNIPACNYPGYRSCKKNAKYKLTCTGDKCTNQYFRTPYEDNTYFAKSSYQLMAPFEDKSKFLKYQELVMQYDILTLGSIVVGMQVYDDFKLYRSGVYHHMLGKKAGFHAVKLIGWGVENDVKYWLAVNTWGSIWGEHGLFKIRRGVDEAGIETTQVSAGTFDRKRSSDLKYFVYDTNDEAQYSGATALIRLSFSLSTLMGSLALARCFLIQSYPASL